MARPKRLECFDYLGNYRYFVTTCTLHRQPLFTTHATVDVAVREMRVAAEKHGFKICAYCFMPDHLHLFALGDSEGADFKRLVRLLKQQTGYHVKRECGRDVWQEGFHDRVLREEEDSASVMRYIVMNPLHENLANEPLDYPFWGSLTHSREEVLGFVSSATEWRPEW